MNGTNIAINFPNAMRWAEIIIGFQPKMEYKYCNLRLLPERQIYFSPMR
ncbi:MAG: hypothetical protein LBN95_13340 [Prevotellaceae bacterium]|nr:hypothetical protein [Prevotellaceae bacterium]